jgi:hypothetical protein
MNEQLENVVGGETLAEPSPGRKALVVFGYALGLFGALTAIEGVDPSIPMLIIIVGGDLAFALPQGTAWEDTGQGVRGFFKKRRVMMVGFALFAVAAHFAGLEQILLLPAWAPSPVFYLPPWVFIGEGILQWRWVRKLHAQNRTNPSPA